MLTQFAYSPSHHLPRLTHFSLFLLFQYAVFLEEFDTSKADAAFAKADAMTTAEIAAEIARGGEWEYQAKPIEHAQPAAALRLATSPGTMSMKSVSVQPTETFKSRVPFLFWA